VDKKIFRDKIKIKCSVTGGDWLQSHESIYHSGILLKNILNNEVFASYSKEIRIQFFSFWNDFVIN
jgi:hypothetical protein